jgi:hypothetical protein
VTDILNGFYYILENLVGFLVKKEIVRSLEDQRLAKSPKTAD